MKSVLILISSLLFMGVPQAYAIDVSSEMKEYVGSICPDLVKKQFSGLAASDAGFSPKEVKNICTCSGKEITKTAKSYTDQPTKQQWFEIIDQSMMQCLKRPTIEAATAGCVRNPETRSSFKEKTGLGDKQFEQFCACHANLVYDESKTGLNGSDPQYKEVLIEKSTKQCLQPLMDADAAGKAKPAR